MDKVLIIGPYFHNYNASISRAFQNLGYETKKLEYHAGEVINLGEKLAYNLSADKTNFFRKKNISFNKKIIEVYHSFKPWLVFIIQGNNIEVETIRALKHSKIALWMMDSIFRSHNGAEKYVSEIDHVFLFEKTDVEKLWAEKKIRSSFMPLALDETIYRPMKKTAPIDILFIGALYDKRIKMIERIVTAFPGRAIRVYGKFYSPFKKPLYHFTRKNKRVFLNKNVIPEKANLLYNASKICLNIHHDQSQYGVNQRFFEIAGSKSFQLVDSNPFILDEFGSEKVSMYATTDEMLNKISEVLQGKMNTAENTGLLYQKVIAKHTFTCRIKQMLEMIYNRPAS